MTILQRIAAWFRPAPVQPETHRRIARRFACPNCGRIVAHTAAGKPYLHHCEREEPHE